MATSQKKYIQLVMIHHLWFKIWNWKRPFEDTWRELGWDPFAGVWFLRKSMGMGVFGAMTRLGVSPDYLVQQRVFQSTIPHVWDYQNSHRTSWNVKISYIYCECNHDIKIGIWFWFGFRRRCAEPSLWFWTETAV